MRPHRARPSSAREDALRLLVREDDLARIARHDHAEPEPVERRQHLAEAPVQEPERPLHLDRPREVRNEELQPARLHRADRRSILAVQHRERVLPAAVRARADADPVIERLGAQEAHRRHGVVDAAIGPDVEVGLDRAGRRLVEDLQPGRFVALEQALPVLLDVQVAVARGLRGDLEIGQARVVQEQERPVAAGELGDAVEHLRPAIHAERRGVQHAQRLEGSRGQVRHGPIVPRRSSPFHPKGGCAPAGRIRRIYGVVRSIFVLLGRRPTPTASPSDPDRRSTECAPRARTRAAAPTRALLPPVAAIGGAASRVPEPVLP